MAAISKILKNANSPQRYTSNRAALEMLNFTALRYMLAQ